MPFDCVPCEENCRTSVFSGKKDWHRKHRDCVSERKDRERQSNREAMHHEQIENGLELGFTEAQIAFIRELSRGGHE